MTNEELARVIQNGDRAKILELWGQVKRYALWRAWKWASIPSGQTVDDLEHEAFIAMLDALERWDGDEGAFLTIYAMRVKAAYTCATGRRTSRSRMEPLNTAVSLNTPVGEDEDISLEELIADPNGEQGIRTVEDMDLLEHLRADMKEAMNGIPAEHREVLVKKYYMGQDVDRRAHSAALRAIRAPAVSRRLYNYRNMLS